MIKVFHGFYARYFPEEESIIFTVLLILFFTVLMTMGSIIAPLLWSLVITYMLQGLVNSMTGCACRIQSRSILFTSIRAWPVSHRPGL